MEEGACGGDSASWPTCPSPQPCTPVCCDGEELLLVWSVSTGISCPSPCTQGNPALVIALSQSQEHALLPHSQAHTHPKIYSRHTTLNTLIQAKTPDICPTGVRIYNHTKSQAHNAHAHCRQPQIHSMSSPDQTHSTQMHRQTHIDTWGRAHQHPHHRCMLPYVLAL